MNARRRRKTPIINDKQKEQIHDLLLKIVGDTIKEKITRLVLAGAVATGAHYASEEPPKAPVAPQHAASK